MEEYRVRLTPDRKALLEKRFKFLCWKCGEIYSIFREVDLKQKLVVSCPNCGAEASVNFGVSNVQEVLRTQNTGTDDGVTFAKFNLPEVLTTKKLEE